MKFRTSFITLQGGLITQEYLDRLYEENCPDIDPRTFKTMRSPAPSSRAELEENIKVAFELLSETWEKIRTRLTEDSVDMDITTARNKWIIPFFEVLDFDLEYQRSYLEVNGDKSLRFPISHKGWSGKDAPVVHTVAPDVDLSRNTGRGNKSPHDIVQAYLNLSQDLWGIVTNGRRLRILRKYHHPYIKGYIEFDIENIFESRQFEDFRVLYLLAHASRFISDSDGKCPLERIYDTCLQAGVSMGKDLRANVSKAIETLANGLLKHADIQYIELLQNNEKEIIQFFAEILEVMYRILFLLFAEQKGMMPGRNTLYLEEYSITHLRQLAEVANSALYNDENTDLWEGLKATFRLLKNGSEELGVPAYNGMLFDDKLTPHLNSMKCSNSDFINVIKYVTLTDKNSVRQRISYKDIGVEELGAIYESLLECVPHVTGKEGEKINDTEYPPNTFVLDQRGTVRKDSGSYYTNPDLVSRLVEEALVPVLEERLEQAGRDQADKERAILSMKVCDPACGSGAFLIGALNVMGLKLAQIRTGTQDPDTTEVQNARRDVLSNCIYGVDLNPLAVELAKVSLWIDGCAADKPLNFLDHHIKCGNSLIGALVEPGIIPDGAFEAIEDDDKNIARSRKKDNQKVSKGQINLYEHYRTRKNQIIKISQEAAEICSMPECSHKDVEAKAEKYKELMNSEEVKKQKIIADIWVYAFFQKYGSNLPVVTTADLRIAKENYKNISTELINAIDNWLEKSEIRPFHWYIEFPEVFVGDDPGFDCILGNPPWNRVKIQDKEFFKYRNPNIANAINASVRKQLIKDLETKNPDLSERYAFFKRMDKSTNKFLKYSDRYPLTAHGDINTYSVFAETAKNLLNSRGRAGIIVPTGIATDDNNKQLFDYLVSNKHMISFYDFENRKGIFPDIDSRYRFSLLIFSGKAVENDEINFAFFNTAAENIDEDVRRIKLTYDDICLINPNTHTCPPFRSKRDLNITRKVYSNYPVLIKEDTSGEVNPYGIKLTTMFHMSNDSGLFIPKDQINYNEPTEHGYMPLYESKLMHQYDHRYATYEGVSGEKPEEFTKRGEYNTIVPRYYVRKDNVIPRLGDWHNEWLLGYRNITNATNERTMIASVLPLSGVGHSINLLLFDDQKAETAALLLANLNSIVFDYIARQKVGGMNLSHFITKQLPVIAPEKYQESAWTAGSSWAEIIIPKVLELTYTAYDVKPFAVDLGYNGEPFKWNDERRFELMRELDAIYAHLYGLEYEELEWILDPRYPSETFRVLKEKEMRAYGQYKTKERVLYYYKNLERLIEGGDSDVEYTFCG